MLRDILLELVSKGTVSVPFTGMALGDLTRNPSYDAAIDGSLAGCKVMDVGGKKRVPSIEVLHQLGFPDIAAAIAAIAAMETIPQKPEPVESAAAAEAPVGCHPVDVA